MLTADEIAGMRFTSEQALPDECTITRPASGGTLNEHTGVWTPNAPTTIYAGRCRLRAPSTEEFEKVFGETQVTETRYIATFPADLPAVEVGDMLTITSSADPHITSELRFRITRAPFGSWLVDRRLGVEVVA